MSVTIEVTKNTASRAITSLEAKLTPQRLAAAVGPACSRLVQLHLRAQGSNKRGWPTTNFWPRAAKATNWQPVAEGVLVSINQIGVRQRYRGGHIAPVNARMLAIPISPVSYGHVPSDFPDLKLVPMKNGAYLVQHGQEEKTWTTKKGIEKSKFVKRGKSAGGNASRRLIAASNFLFKLVSGVDQKPDPGVLPSREELTATALGAIQAAISPRATGGNPS